MANAVGSPVRFAAVAGEGQLGSPPEQWHTLHLPLRRRGPATVSLATIRSADGFSPAVRNLVVAEMRALG